MRKRTIRGLITFLLVMGMVYPCACYADGLRTGFGKIILENVPMGRTYSMRNDSKFPLRVKNESDRTINLKIEVLVPQEDEIQHGYEAIPNKEWLSLERNEFAVEPNGEAETDVLIHVPYDKRYAERKFHVFIMSYTTGQSLGIGIKSKLLFSVEKAKNV